MPSDGPPPTYPQRAGAFPELDPPATPAALRVVVADDNPVVRAGLTALLNGRYDIDVVAEAADGREAYTAAVEHQPDVILLDVRMPGVDGLSALPHLVQVAPVMMLTYSRESEIVQEALRRGAEGYLVHGEFTADELVAAVGDIKQGRSRFTPTAANALLAHFRHDARSGPALLPDGLGQGSTTSLETPSQPQPSVAGSSSEPPRVWQAPVERAPQGLPDREGYGMSQREVEVMELIATGLSNQQIAATCFISEKTVKNHINRIFTKLHAANRSEAIAIWLGTARGSGGGTVRHG
ncbi:response regulator transcription factor [Streptomyces sp. A7024]|uniref:Response regulator transcription factor n=1 Tax=Streptomyces coryli TaxID=1128680 RepID=A0A6G4U4P6_9ACTN|nr:response regulator transcription factor [Streptomyces coryli]NGN67063.1 response regulator transcription factor [Streptomyces coryli]